jgi:hypothetical protein
VGFEPLHAVLAGPIRATQPRDRDSLVDADAGDAFTESVDEADALVPRDKRQGRLDRPVAVGGVDVRVADAGGLDLDADLPRARLGDRPVLDDQGLWNSRITAARM